MKPQPRAETVAFAVSELLLKDASSTSLETKASRTRVRTCTSADRGSRHSSYMPNNRVSPYEKTYVFTASQTNYVDGSDIAQQYSDKFRSSQGNKGSFLQEISKLSQMNITRLNNKCSYTVLTGSHTDSTESLLRQHASPPGDHEEIEMSTPTRGTMVKSKSAYVIKKKYDISPSFLENGQKKKMEVKKITREPISVPNFTVLTLPTPVLTPVEAARLVFLDSDEGDDEDDNHIGLDNSIITEVQPSNNFNTVKRGESYNSHLGYADNPLYQHLVNSNSAKISRNYSNVPEVSDENISSTSDYASIETMNRLSSASNYSMKTNTPQEEIVKNRNNRNEPEGPFGFCNPNYLGPDIKSLLNGESFEKKQFQKYINTPDSLMDEGNIKSEDEDILELQNYNGSITKNTKVFYRSTARNTKPPKTLALDNTNRLKELKSRASSTSRVERNRNKEEKNKTEPETNPQIEPFVPLYIFIFGGKEQGQVTVFQRPLSVWRLKLY